MPTPSKCSLTLALGLVLSAPSPTRAAEDLTALSLESLMQISVQGASKYEQKQEEVAAAASIITRDEIKAFGWRTIDEALASLPGIQSSYDRQYNYVGIRGFSVPGDFNSRFLLTLNGNRVNDVVYDTGLSGRAFPVDVDLIERIEFIPGPGGAVYGQNAMLGVVNVVTRSGVGVDGTELSASYQDLHAARSGRVTWGKTLENGLDVVLSATAFKTRGEDHFYDFGLAGVSGEAKGMDGAEDQKYFVHLARGPWSFDLSYGDYRKDDPTAQYFSDPLTDGQYQEDRHFLTQLQYQDWLEPGSLQFTGRLFLGRERYEGRFYYSGDPTKSTGSSNWHGLELRLLSTAWSDHKLLLGLEAQDNTRVDQTFEDPNNPANDVNILDSGWRGGLYVQDEWKLGDSLSTTLGLRFDHNTVNGNAWSPRAALIWQAAPETTVKALYGRAHRAPNAFERDYGDAATQVANPGLDGETIDTLELVLDQRVGRDLRLRGSLYHWRMQNLVVLGVDSGSGLSQYQSSDERVEATGLELSADQTFRWGGRLRGSLSYQDVAYDNGDWLDNSPRYLGKLNFSGPLASTGLRFGAELLYTSKRQSLDGSDLDAYWLANLNLSSDRLAKGLEVSLGLYNLFDEDYSDPGSDINWQNAIEQDGRSVRVKLDYRF